MLRKAYDVSFQGLMTLVERDLVPDWLIRRGIRHLLSQRVAEVSRKSLFHSVIPPHFNGDQLSDHSVTLMFRLAGEVLRSSNNGSRHLSTN